MSAADERERALAYIAKEARVEAANEARNNSFVGDEDARRANLDNWKALLPIEALAVEDRD